MKNALLAAPIGVLALGMAGNADARSMVWGGKLPLTRGVTSIEGGTGAGLSTWALIAGNETEDGVGGSVFYTAVPLSDYDFSAYGAAIGLFDRVEFSYAHQSFDTGSTGGALGIGNGFTFEQDIWGAKLRLFGDAVYDQNSWLPQFAVGVQYKQAEHDALISALGGEDDSGLDIYVSATKILLEESLVLNATVRATDANQFGLLGFGGDREGGRTMQFEVSGAYMLADDLLVGVEYRSRPDNLGFAEEEDGFDVFAAYAVTDNLTLVAGYVDLGSIATFDDQNGAYLSLQIGF
ncbi:MAG: DUF3034 family protein [Alphaproteobacteria bacterium]|nr:DUF3034 family protein [Alphaproteobacteria bacterium]